MRLADLAEIAVEAARAGGRVVRGRGPSGVTLKAAGDYVSEVDRASEAAVGEVLRTRTPGIAVLAEEAGGPRDEDRYWVVDPLDGTTNFLHGFPAVGVSVALVQDGEPVAGAVNAPLLGGQTWVGWTGGGAWAGSERVSVSGRPAREAVVGTGFPFRRKASVPRYVRMFQAAFERFEDLRRPGAAALDLAWVASGVFDGFFELGLGPWDVAAGALLIREAGGIVTDWEGGDGFLDTGDILAGPPEVHDALRSIAQRTATGS